MIIYLFNNFSKRENSTKRPDISSGDVYNCTLKNPTSVIDPIIEIDHADQVTFKNYSYAYIPDFYRYYMVENITSDGRFWIYALQTDVLATYRREIGAASLYMVRSSGEYDGYIVDNYYPATGKHQTRRTQANTPWLHASNENIAIDEGVFVLGVTSVPYSTGAGSYGSIRYYAVKMNQMLTFITALMSNTITSANGFDFTEASQSLQKSLIDPLSYIKSCIWFPILYENIDGIEMSTIKVWDWDINATCKLITKNPPYVMYATNLNILPHPQDSRGKYLNLSPYTALTLQYPPFGLLNLDTSMLIDAETVRCQVLIDLITGSATLDIFAPYGNISSNMQRIKSQIGVDIQLTQVGYDYSNYVASGIGIAAEAAQNWLGDLMGSGISNAVNQIGNAANAMRTKVSSIGGNGSFAELRGFAYLYHDFYLVPDEDRSHAGRPLCRMIRPDTRDTGIYYMALLGDIALPDGTVGEHAAVKSYLEGGFYYE